MHTLTAVATDSGGAVSASAAVEIFVSGTGGSLVGSLVTPPGLSASIDLTAEGTRDWVHWGFATNALVNRKATLLEPTLTGAKELGGKEQSAPSMYQLALQYREKGLKAEEERTFKKCLKLDQKYAMCHYGLHLLFKEDQRDKEATIACRNFLKFAAMDEFPAEIENCEKFVSASSF